METEEQAKDRRPIAARGNPRIVRLARRLGAAGIWPSQVSVLSVVFAALAALAMLIGPHSGAVLSIVLFVAAALGIELRLLCNVVDGLIAVEGGLRSPTGAIFNEFPDRISDVCVILAAGYLVSWLSWGPTLGWLAAVLAVVTAYTRALGKSVGAASHFEGVMDKKRRMEVLVVACIASAIEAQLGAWHGYAMTVALVVISVGCLQTVVVRLRGIGADLEAANAS